MLLTCRKGALLTGGYKAHFVLAKDCMLGYRRGVRAMNAGEWGRKHVASEDLQIEILRRLVASPEAWVHPLVKPQSVVYDVKGVLPRDAVDGRL